MMTSATVDVIDCPPLVEDQARSSFGPWLTEVLHRRRLSQRGLAALVGVSQTTVGRWCAGTDSPHPMHAARVAEALGEDSQKVLALAGFPGLVVVHNGEHGSPYARQFAQEVIVPVIDGVLSPNPTDWRHADQVVRYDASSVFNPRGGDQTLVAWRSDQDHPIHGIALGDLVVLRLQASLGAGNLVAILAHNERPVFGTLTKQRGAWVVAVADRIITIGPATVVARVEEIRHRP